MDRTLAWVHAQLRPGERVVSEEPLRGGWTSSMRRFGVRGPDGARDLVLRSFETAFFRRHAPGLLRREADVLTLLAGTGIAAAGLVAVDTTGEHCTHPSLLMTRLPGTLRLTDEGADARAVLLAQQLVDIHSVPVSTGDRPRAYQAWSAPDRVRIPEATRRPALWRRAVDVIRRDAPAHQGRFLHRDFHPGNVLFHRDPSGQVRISGVVDWVETSWGPADLDVSHCATALALLHGAAAGLRFPGLYASAGGQQAADPDDRLYWRLLDALGFAPDAEKVAGPWRECGRPDLTASLAAARLEDYLQGLLDAHPLPASRPRGRPEREGR
ncbi:aminoglycoside phosphotransferase family protein [Streptomyces sp. ACA25]|uniref:phosphotransferase family protein n=1 Tax=Streptomyces sp. ACA25 TaxID=3022596 RepID=UPI00230756B7|nr:aminoglycoside phosphotransferase family protein [Streptomyces sp. ACA25]MDB1088629.1 aminoglycoside phosphotransferase family protein [Streptomyces sp. ACA25]